MPAYNSMAFIVAWIIFSALGYLSGFLLSVPIHECGHLLFGLVSGYRFVFLRLFRFLFYRDNKKLVVTHSTPVQGIAGQCIMCPKSDAAGVFLYNAGGFLANLIVSLFCFWLCYVLLNTNTLALTFYFLGFGLVNLLTAAINLFPKTNPIPNDGRNLLELRNKEARKAFLIGLKVNARLTEGNSYSVFSQTELLPAISADKNNYMVANQYILLALYYSEVNQLEKAEAVLKNLDISKLPVIYQGQVQVHLLYLALLKNDLGLARSLYTEAVQLVLTSGEFDLLCIRAAFDILVQGHPALEILKQLEEMANRFPTFQRARAMADLAQLKRLIQKNSAWFQF